jgi:hypothetical protein
MTGVLPHPAEAVDASSFSWNHVGEVLSNGFSSTRRAEETVRHLHRAAIKTRFPILESSPRDPAPIVVEVMEIGRSS